MTRSIGGVQTWGNFGEVWANTDPAAGPLAGASWSGFVNYAVQYGDLATRLLDDPNLTDGQVINGVSSGGLRFVVQVLNPTAGIDSVWGTALWGTSLWSAAVGQWEDISCRVQLVKWKQGQNAPNGKTIVGNATVQLENLDGLASPYATSGHYVGFLSSSWLRAGLHIRWGVIKTTTLAAGLPALATFEAVFTGKVEYVAEINDEANVDSYVELTIAETTAAIGAVDPADQSTQQSRALTGTIFDAMIASGWPYQAALVVPGEEATVPATTLQGGSSSQRLDLLTDGMHWDWMADGRGRLEIVRRHFAESSSGIVFANKPSAGQYPALTIIPYSNVERLLNFVTAARINAEQFGNEDARSVQQFGTLSSGYGFPRADLVLETDAQVAALLARVLSFRAWDDLGIAQFSLNLDMDPINLPAILTYVAAHAREAVSFVVVYTHPSGKVLTEVVVIEAQDHTVQPLGAPGTQLLWTATLTTGHSGVVTES